MGDRGRHHTLILVVSSSHTGACPPPMLLPKAPTWPCSSMWICARCPSYFCSARKQPGPSCFSASATPPEILASMGLMGTPGSMKQLKREGQGRAGEC